MKTLSALVLGAALALGPAAAALAENIVLYASGSAEATQELVRGFNDKYPNIKVSVVRAGTGSLMQRIKAESANPQADVFIDGGLGTLAAYKDNFEPYLSPEAKNYPKDLVGDDNLWLGVVSHVHVFLVNTKSLRGAAVPQTWADLLKPAWKGKVIMGNPEQSSSSYAQIWGVQKHFGDAGFQTLAQIASTVGTSSAVSSGVSRGEFPVAVTLEYLAQDYVQNGAKDLVVIYPKDGALVSYTGVAIVKGAKNRAQARIFYDYVASKESRERVLKESFKRPGRTDLDIARISPLPALTGHKVLVIDEGQAASDYGALLAKWKQIHSAR
jgi:iron(III) transport system substrate-binding protein